MSASTPVVLANAILPHLVEDGVNGYLFEPNNAQGFGEEAGGRALPCPLLSVSRWVVSPAASWASTAR